MSSILTLAQVDDIEGFMDIIDKIGTVGIVAIVLISILVIVGFWKIFEKAGKPGALALTALIPIVGGFIFLYFVLEIIDRPWWWLLLLLIPFVNLVILVVIQIDLAKSFGKGVPFAIGLIFLGFIFVPILGFGSATYIGPRGQAGVAA